MLQLLAGLALITFGVRFLRKGFNRLLGAKVAMGVERVARTPLRAMSVGVAFGAVAPSSTGIAVFIGYLLSLGKIQTDRVLALLLGANVGLTILANLVAFSIGRLTGVLLFFGVLAFQFCRRECVRGIGQCLLALGFVFLAMQFMREAALGISGDADTVALLHALERFPWILCGVAALLGVFLQSSTAMVGIGISLTQGGVLPSSLFLIWIVGTNLGLGLTSLIVAWPQAEGRRLGYANLIAKLLIAFPLLLFLPTADPFRTEGAIPLPNQLALSHTAFNLAAALVSLPLLNPLLSLASTWVAPDISDKEHAGDMQRSHLDPDALSRPSLALAQANREVQRMTDEVKRMLCRFWAAREREDIQALRKIIRQDDEVDDLNRQLTIYLGRIGVNLTAQQNAWRFSLLKISAELEAVGDVVERSLSGTVIRQLQRRAQIGSDEEAGLVILYERTMQQLDLILTLLTNRDEMIAEEIVKAKNEMMLWCAVEKQTIERMLRPDAKSVEVTICYLDMMEGLRQINKHLARIAGSVNTAVDQTAAESDNTPSRAHETGQSLMIVCGVCFTGLV